MYKSPIEIIQGELHTKMDGAIMKAVQQVGISVNKSELLHALAYDRSQYQLGFIDGKREAMKEIVQGENISENGFLCSVCTFGDFGGFHGYEPNFCPNCGAKMDERREDDKG